MQKKNKWLDASLLLALLLIICSACHPTKEERLAETRRAFRRLTLPLQLKDDELELSNDRLELDIAKLKGKHQDPTKFRIAVLVVGETKRAIQISEKIERIISQSDDPATKDQRIKFASLEQRLDKLIEACHSGALAAKTVQEAQTACASLDSIYQEAMSK